jgi:hypothetical protein
MMNEPSKPEDNEVNLDSDDAGNQKTRRDFLRSLGRWSAIIIGGTALAGKIAESDAAGWVNGGGGGWVNARGGGGGAAWVNKAGGGGAAWVNKAGGGGGGWVNARGGGGSAAWVNRR